MYDKPSLYKTNEEYVNEKKMNTYYGTKLRVAVVGFVLFLLFSQNVAYKILDIVIQLFNSRIHVIDEDENPVLIGNFIMAAILAVILFLI